MPGHDIIAIGASAGGVEALQTLIHLLPSDLPAAVFIVLHMPAQGPSLLPKILERVTRLHVRAAEDGAPIEHGVIYVTAPDHHLLIKRDRIQALRGPRENGHRPAVDPLFRTAAYFYGPRVVGVVLTGALDDGTAGLMAIKQCGGQALVQDPQEAFYPSMPQSAIQNVAVDAVVPLAELAERLAELAHTPVVAPERYVAPERIEQEIAMMEMDPALQHDPNQIGQPSEFSCPECGGVLHELHNDDIVRFRCRVGHAFSAESTLAEQAEALETALWSALNTLEESASLSQRMARRAQQSGRDWMARRFEEKAREAQQHAQTIREVLLKDSSELPDAPLPGKDRDDGPRPGATHAAN